MGVSLYGCLRRAAGQQRIEGVADSHAKQASVVEQKGRCVWQRVASWSTLNKIFLFINSEWLFFIVFPFGRQPPKA
ncbi:hypothetical protein BZG13_06025 [Salinivibrio sp. ML323]|nr:hypothetical protein BZG13_06025 [Salinivibrio sp. ML323]